MLDGVSLDQLRAFAAAADHGSFSAAARHLRRAQSAVSELVANLEAQLGVPLFDRGGRYPKLTPAGHLLLADARTVMASLDALKARAKGMAGGLEPELSVVVDVFVPLDAVTALAEDFRQQFPAMPLRLYVEALSGVVQPLLDGRASLGIVGPQPALPAALSAEPVSEITFVMVASPRHPLASLPAGRGLSRAELARHVQLVLTERDQAPVTPDVGVLSPATWRLADLFAKHAFLVNGLGWGSMPLHTVQADLDAGRLVMLDIEGDPPGGYRRTLSAIYPTASPPGPAGRWMIERLKQGCARVNDAGCDAVHRGS